jgi:hypothetical protein
MNSFRSRAVGLIATVTVLFLLLPAGAGATDTILWKPLGPGDGGTIISVAVSPATESMESAGSRGILSIRTSSIPGLSRAWMPA